MAKSGKINCPDMSSIKVILTAGGKGTRVHELTGSLVPKSLIRLDRKFSKPLVGYQLDLLKKFGLTDVFVMMDADWQIPLFKQSIRVGEIPKLNYSFGINKWKHPLVSFKRMDVIKFVGDSDFLWTYGDVLYDEKTFKKMMAVYRKNNTSVSCAMNSNSYRWKKDGKYLKFVKDKDDRITNFIYSRNKDFTIHAPFIFQNRAFKVINKELKKTNPRTLPLLLKLIRDSQLSVIKPSMLVNMNMPEDIIKIKGILSKIQ